MTAGRDERQLLALLGAATQVIFATLIAGVSALAGTAEPDFLPRPVVLFAASALPGVVGLIAIDQRRRAALLAAAGASAIGSVLAFSGVTLIFLVPAVLMGVGSMRVQGGDGTRRSRFGEAVRAVLVLVLLVAAGGSAILITDERCWGFSATPGGIVIDPAPLPSVPRAIDQGGSGYGCSNGLISVRGVGLGAIFGIAALTVTAAPHRRRRQSA